MRLELDKRAPRAKITKPHGRNPMALRFTLSFHITGEKPQALNWYVGTENTWTLPKAKLVYARLYAVSEY
jgi:hypothetical protein